MLRRLALFIKKVFMSDISTIEPTYLLAGEYEKKSYLSYDFALSFHGLIPEVVYVYSSAMEHRKKRYSLQKGHKVFSYQHIPESAFSLGVNLMYENGFPFRIASPEKALCDKLFLMPHIHSLQEMEDVLEYELRIDMDVIPKLNLRLIRKLAGLYPSGNVNILVQYLEKRILCTKQ